MPYSEVYEDNCELLANYEFLLFMAYGTRDSTFDQNSGNKEISTYVRRPCELRICSS